MAVITRIFGILRFFRKRVRMYFLQPARTAQEATARAKGIRSACLFTCCDLYHLNSCFELSSKIPHKCPEINTVGGGIVNRELLLIHAQLHINQFQIKFMLFNLVQANFPNLRLPFFEVYNGLIVILVGNTQDLGTPLTIFVQSFQLELFAGDAVTNRFYSPYVLAALQAVGTPSVTLAVKEGASPLFFEAAGESFNLVYLVMPVLDTKE